MIVCDVCMGSPAPYLGEPQIHYTDDTGNRRGEYLFHGGSDSYDKRVDLCKVCIELMRKRAWAELGKRAQEVQELRLREALFSKT